MSKCGSPTLVDSEKRHEDFLTGPTRNQIEMDAAVDRCQDAPSVGMMIYSNEVDFGLTTQSFLSCKLSMQVEFGLTIRSFLTV